MRSFNRQERRELVRDLRAALPDLPEPILIAFSLLTGATLEGRAAVVLVKGGDTVRVSMIHAESHMVADTLERFDGAFSTVPVAFDQREGADAKSTH